MPDDIKLDYEVPHFDDASNCDLREIDTGRICYQLAFGTALRTFSLANVVGQGIPSNKIKVDWSVSCTRLRSLCPKQGRAPLTAQSRSPGQ
jgi:hypothetical protein